METKQHQERYLIEFREEKYNERLEKYHKYLNDCENLRVFINDQLDIKADDLDFKDENLFETILTRFSSKYEKQNTLNLKPFKLAELLEVNLDGVYSQISNLKQKHEVFNEPDREKYCLYVYEPEMIELAKKCEKIKELLIETGMEDVSLKSLNKLPLSNSTAGLRLNPFYFQD